MDYYADLGIEIDGFAKGGMPARNKKNYRSTKSGAGMTARGSCIQKDESWIKIKNSSNR